MKYLLTTVLAIAAGHSAVLGRQEKCGVPLQSNSSNYIFRGDDALPGEFPWQVSLQEPDGYGGWLHTCGGSIISKDWILTAAHCVDPQLASLRLRAVVGARDISRQERTASSQRISFKRDVIIHPLWNSMTIDYDYALIQLPKPLDFEGKHAHLTPICLPEANNAKVFEEMNCTATGWGFINNAEQDATVLQKLPVRLPKHEQCVRAWIQGGVSNGGVALTRRHLCAASKRGEGSGVCSGDSGGPLQCVLNGRAHLAGVASFVRYCGSSGRPDVYARVTEARSWIEQVLARRTRK